tara:strand:- start:204 stop:608 length:405 start_codon:yes stop_codon:yes gene_type:complete
MKPKGGVTLIIAVGGGKPPHHGHSNRKKKGCEMIKIPMEALVSDDEAGEGVSPEVGDMVGLSSVEGEVKKIGDDGSVHVELQSANGQPVEYVSHDAKEHDEKKADAEEVQADEMEAEESMLRAMAEEEDEKAGY